MFPGVPAAPPSSLTLAAAAANCQEENSPESRSLESNQLVLTPDSETPDFRLLHFDGRAGFGELGADGLGLFLRDAFLDRLRRGLDQVLRLFQAERRDLADDLDDVNLLAGVNAGEDHVELGLLFRRGRG